ncbi:MAG: hypothetical protein OCD03_05640 [Hyphomicrobiales bacterium]
MTDPRHEIINQVHANMHSAINLGALSDYYTDNFSFVSPLRPGIGFEEYCVYLSEICNHGEMEFIDIIDHGRYITVQFWLMVVDRKAKIEEKFKATVEFHFQQYLIERMVFSYGNDPLLAGYISKNFISDK